MTTLAREFYRRDVVAVARALLGQMLVREVDGQRMTGVIVETEAYLGEVDRAAHTFGGRRTARNASMWGDGGYAYVYFTYGMHHCLNAVAGCAENPSAVLIRALEPVTGLSQMYHHRPAAKRESDLCSGPAKLCQALRIDRALDGVDLTSKSELWIELTRSRTLPASKIRITPRIGIESAGEWRDKPLRFCVADHPCVSR